jgi:hypothetical protein
MQPRHMPSTSHNITVLQSDRIGPNQPRHNAVQRLLGTTHQTSALYDAIWHHHSWADPTKYQAKGFYLQQDYTYSYSPTGSWVLVK